MNAAHTRLGPLLATRPSAPPNLRFGTLPGADLQPTGEVDTSGSLSGGSVDTSGTLGGGNVTDSGNLTGGGLATSGGLGNPALATSSLNGGRGPHLSSVGGGWSLKRSWANFSGSGSAVIVGHYVATFTAPPGTLWSITTRGVGPARIQWSRSGAFSDTGATTIAQGFLGGRAQEVRAFEHTITYREVDHDLMLGLDQVFGFLPWPGLPVEFRATLFSAASQKFRAFDGLIRSDSVVLPDPLDLAAYPRILNQ